MTSKELYAVQRAAGARLIVSRHPAAIAFLRAECPEFRDAAVVEVATADAVGGRVVGGNLPLHLAALCREVVAVEFDGPPPRGAEYGDEEMRAAGARIARYTVHRVVECTEEDLSPCVVDMCAEAGSLGDW